MRENSYTVEIKIKNHQAMHDMLYGNGNRDTVDTLIAAMNMCEAYAIYGRGTDWLPEIKQAQDAIFSMAQRGLKKERFLFTGEEMKAINLGMEIHDAQLDASTVKELEKVVNYVQEQIRLKKARPISVKENVKVG